MSRLPTIAEVARARTTRIGLGDDAERGAPTADRAAHPPVCYAKDVTQKMVDDYRKRNEH
jgi:hypothetical protein